MSPRSTGRRLAREAAFRVAYQADLSGDSYPVSWERRRPEEEGLAPDQLELVADVVSLLESRGPEVDDALQSALDAKWSLPRLAATDRAVLRISVAELLARPGSPARVVLDESIEIARTFGSDESGRCENGVLDRVARTLRPDEF
ncbi:MAG: transcription antitermination factor NusB [bacterium]